MTEEAARQLLATRTETRNVDFKETFDWVAAAREGRLELVKDMLAMANTAGGGHIVLGVTDNTFDPVGVGQPAYESFDQTRVNDFFREFTDPLHYCAVHKFHLDGRMFVFLHIPEFKELPIICAADGNTQRGTVLRRGQIYMRTDRATSESIGTSEDMRELIERAMLRAAGRFASTFKNLSNALIAYRDISPPDKEEE